MRRIRILVIGAGAVANVFMVMAAIFSKWNPQLASIFSDLILASRRLESCELIQKNVFNRTGKKIVIHQVDANDVAAVIALIRKVRPMIVVNLATPTTDLAIMTACVETGVFYLDTANYQPPDSDEFRYEWQWGMDCLFRYKKILAILGCGFDPGAIGIYVAYMAKHVFDKIYYLDILDCNAGNHGRPFATNFDPWTNITEVSQRGKFWENGRWIETDPIIGEKPGRDDYKIMFKYPGVPKPKESYLIFHEDLQSLVKNFALKGLRRARFWMTFGQEYLTPLWVLKNVGMTDIKKKIEVAPEVYITPLDFLAKVLPDPGSLGETYTGNISICCRIVGEKNGREKTAMICHNSEHQMAYKLTGGQGISYSTALPLLVILKEVATGEWSGIGVHNVEEFDPDPVMRDMNEMNIPWDFYEDEDVSELNY